MVSREYSDFGGILHAKICSFDCPSYDFAELEGEFNIRRQQRKRGFFGERVSKVSTYLIRNSRENLPLVLDMEKVISFDTSGISSIINLINFGKNKLFIVHYSNSISGGFEVIRGRKYIDGELVFQGVDFRLFKKSSDLLKYLSEQ